MPNYPYYMAQIQHQDLQHQPYETVEHQFYQSNYNVSEITWSNDYDINAEFDYHDYQPIEHETTIIQTRWVKSR